MSKKKWNNRKIKDEPEPELRRWSIAAGSFIRIGELPFYTEKRIVVLGNTIPKNVNVKEFPPHV